MSLTTTEILLFIGMIVPSVLYHRLIVYHAAFRNGHLETIQHNKTLYDLYCQNHQSAIALMNALDKSHEALRESEKHNYKLALENIELKLKYIPKNDVK